MALTLTLVVKSSPAMAESAHESTASDLLKDAELLMAEGKVANACPRYAESYRLDAQLGVLFRLAECHERLGKTASAWRSFRELAALAERQGDARQAVALQRAIAIESRLSRLRVVVPVQSLVDGLEVHRNGVLLAPALWGAALPVDPGQYTITFSAPGRSSSIRQVRFWGEGSSQTVTAPLLQKASVPGVAKPGEPKLVPASATANPGHIQRGIGWAALGTSAGGFAIGLAFSVERMNRLAERDAICPSSVGCLATEKRRIDELTSQARSATELAVVASTLGVALATTGLVLIVTAADGTRALSAAPWLGGNAAGLAIDTNW